MLERLQEAPDRIVGLRASGAVTARDVEETIGSLDDPGQSAPGGLVVVVDRDFAGNFAELAQGLTNASLARRSLVVPGAPDGIFRTLYQLDRESLSEVRNATVHAFLAQALVPHDDGYRLYWAVYVKPVSRWTRLYMAAIDPFRRLVVYPSLLRRIAAAWNDRQAAPVS